MHEIETASTLHDYIVKGEGRRERGGEEEGMKRVEVRGREGRELLVLRVEEGEKKIWKDFDGVA